MRLFLFAAAVLMVLALISAASAPVASTTWVVWMLAAFLSWLLDHILVIYWPARSA